MDGVIIDHTDSKLILAKRLGYDLTPQQTASDEIQKIIPSEILSNIRSAIYDDADIAMLANLMTGAVESLDSLKKSFVPIFLVSRRHNPNVPIDFMKAKGLWPEYFNAENSFFVATVAEKNSKAKEIGVTHFLDDEMNVIEVLKDVPNRFYFDRFNLCGDGDGYTRVVSWEDFLKKVYGY